MIKRSIFFAVLFTLILAPVVYAQDVTPPTGNPLIELIESLGAVVTSLIIGATSTLSSGLTNWIRHLAFLSDGDKSKISGLAADLLNVISSLLVSIAAIGIAYAIGLVQDFNLPDFLPMLAALTATTSGGASLVVYNLHKALKK